MSTGNIVGLTIVSGVVGGFIWLLVFCMVAAIIESEHQRTGGKLTDEEIHAIAIWPLWLVLVMPIKLVRFLWKTLIREWKKAIQ